MYTPAILSAIQSQTSELRRSGRIRSCPSCPKVWHIFPITLTQLQQLTVFDADAKISKRPLLHPAISSPYAGPHDAKIVYVSAKTPFLSAVKRVEKLLHLADKRAVQSATTEAKKALRKRKRGAEDADEIGIIAGIVEGRRNLPVGKDGMGNDQGGRRGEKVTIKGTGKAVQRVMELGLWFQQREEYEVQLRTGTVGAIDDVEVGEEAAEEHAEEEKEGGDAMDVDTTERPAAEEQKGDKKEGKAEDLATSGARIRYLSVLEVAVSLR